MIEKKEIIERIREEYSGLRDMPRKSLNSSLRTLADDLYKKELHFIFELIQNAEDNGYKQYCEPSLQLQLDLSGDIPHLNVVNNETWFEENHIEAVCQVGQCILSLKKGPHLSFKKGPP